MNDKGPFKHILDETPLEADYRFWSFALDIWSKIIACLLAPIALVAFNQKYWWATIISLVSILIMGRYLAIAMIIYWKQNFHIIPNTLKVLFTKERHRKEYAPISRVILDMTLLIGSAIGLIVVSLFLLLTVSGLID